MRLLSLLLVLTSSITFAQIDITKLKNGDINSESDLRNLGVKQSEIDALKQEYSGNELNNSSLPKEVQETKSIPAPVEVNKKIDNITQNSESVKEAVFGQSIFRSGSVNIQVNNDRVIPPAGYVLGPGDRISVSIWGISQFNGEFLLDEFGNITPNLVGRIALKGKTFSQAQKIIKSRFSQVYRFNSAEIAINLSYSKVISVNIVGEVLSPGTFSIPSINSAFNILSLAKGLTQKGSVRNISIVRNGKIISNLDIYEFMNNPEKNSLTYLSDGDFIVVPTLTSIISITGEVQKEGKYELKDSETLSDLLMFSGGFTALANKKSISILRQTENGKAVLTYPIEKANDVKMYDGDQVIVAKNSQYINNKVTVSGQVNSPGIFEFTEGETFNNLIKRANGFTNAAYLKTAHIYRLRADLRRELIPLNLLDSNYFNSFKILDLDEILILDKHNFIDTNYVSMNGTIRNEGEIHFKTGMTLRDAMALVGGALPQAYLKRIEIGRINFKDSNDYVKIIFKDFETDADFELMPFDIVHIRSLPEFKFHESIEVIGEVKYPGKYSLTHNKVKTSDIIKRAGGITNLAYGEKAYIERTEDSLGIILLDLELVLKNDKDPFNYSLLPGDKIVVPRVNDIVSISGAIGSTFIDKEENINVPHKNGKRASYYIKKYAGGYDRKALKRKVFAVTLNGQVKKTKALGLAKPKIEKGDKIIVKFKQPKKTRTKSEKIDWNRVIESTSVKVTGLLTLYLLFQNAFGG